jgi:signal transduction histidine kinase
MSGRSLRGRLLGGAVFWSIGLLLLASVGLSTAVDYHPAAAIHVHRALAFGFVVPAIAVLCLIAGVFYVRRGLTGVSRLHERLSALRAGHTHRLDGTYPSEVQPLVDDLNELLDERDRAVERAVAKAADLAHGLKTPLAVLAHEANRADRAGQDEVAAAIHHQVDRMRKQVDYQLAHARAAVPGRSFNGRVVIRDSVEGLVRALERLHADRSLLFDLHLDPSAAARGHAFDIDEMLGNLLDNACRWARSRVIVSASTDGPHVLVAVDDDGPGLDRTMREAVLRRGVRADESGPGSGLGLAIVCDLADLYGGSLLLADSPVGGLRAELRLPA